MKICLLLFEKVKIIFSIVYALLEHYRSRLKITSRSLLLSTKMIARSKITSRTLLLSTKNDLFIQTKHVKNVSQLSRR